MQTASEAAAAEVTAASYARRGVSRRGGLRRWAIAGGLVGLLVVTLGVASRVPRVLERVLGRQPAAATYVVKPVDLSITLIEDGEIKPKNSVDIKCQIEGQSTLLWVVEESTRVKKGDLLVQLADDQIKNRIEAEEIELGKIRAAYKAAEQELEITKSENASKLKKAQIDLEVAELELEKYLKGDYQKALKAVEIAIAQSELDIEQKREQVRKNRALVQRGFVTQSRLEQLEFELRKAEMTRDQNLLARQILQDYELKMNQKRKASAAERAREELEREKKRALSREKQAKARLEEQQKLLAMREKRLKHLKEQRDKCRICAPVDGLVQYPSNGWGWRSDRNRISPGEKVYEGQTLIVLPDTSQMVVETRIHEADRHKVREGLECLVTVPAVPGKTFRGRVSKIARFADSANRWLNPELKEHATEILLAEADPRLSPGDSAEIKILIERASGVLAVPVQCVYTRGTRSFVFASRGGRAQPVEVKLGRSSITMVEVIKGLAPGDQVLMHADEELLARLPAPAVAQADWQRRARRADRAEARKARAGRQGARHSRAAGARRPARKQKTSS